MAAAGAQQGTKYAVEKELVLDDVPDITEAGHEDITNVVRRSARTWHVCTHGADAAEVSKPVLTNLTATQVAEAPKVHTAQHVQSLRDLENGGAGHLASLLQNGKTGQGSVDLSLLTQCLTSQEHVEEPDTFWDEAMLLTELASELQKEREEQERLATDIAV